MANCLARTVSRGGGSLESPLPRTVLDLFFSPLERQGALGRGQKSHRYTTKMYHRRRSTLLKNTRRAVSNPGKKRERPPQCARPSAVIRSGPLRALSPCCSDVILAVFWGRGSEITLIPFFLQPNKKQGAIPVILVLFTLQTTASMLFQL